MQSNGPLGFAIASLLLAVVIALGVLIFQIDTLETRFIQQSQQLRALAEATDRLASRLERAGGRALGAGESEIVSDADRYADVKVLHPEVENLLGESDFSIVQPGSNDSGLLVRGWSSGDPKGFNPIIENAAEFSSLIGKYAAAPIAERMAWTDPDRWRGNLAWRIEVTDDFKEFTIYLRPGVKWHTPSGVDLSEARYAWLDGVHEVTAHDIVFALDMTMHPQVENGFAKSYYQDLESWEALDDHTLRIRWKKKLYGSIESTLSLDPLPEFLYAYDERGERLPEETIGLRFNQHWYNNKGYVGAGPYRMVSYQPGVEIVLERNEDFHGEKPSIRNIEYPIYTDSKRTLNMLRSGELSSGGLTPSDYREELLKWQDRPQSEWPKGSPFLNGQLRCEKLSSPAYSYIGWNADKPMFADKRVRRAMTLALNRRSIVEDIYVGLGSLATGPFLASSPYNDPDVDPLDFDLSRAAALLAEAGWLDSDGDGLLDKDLDPESADSTRTAFEFALLIYANAPEWLSAANVFQRDLLSLGVKMKIVTAEWSLMQKRMDEKEFDAFSGGWALGWDSDPYQLWHSSQADIPKGSNRVGFRNERADRLIEQLRETFDRQQRIDMLREVHRIIYEEQAYTFFRVPEGVYCWQKEVADVRFALLRPRTNSLPWWVEEGR